MGFNEGNTNKQVFRYFPQLETIEKMSNDLSQLRNQIDLLDQEILAQLNARAALARKVGSLKVGQAYRPEREAGCCVASWP